MKPGFSAQRFISLFDLHIGWERKRFGREAKLVRTHSPAAIASTMAFIKDFKPDRILLGGDEFNFAPISHWNKGKLWANTGGNIKREMDEFNELILGPLDNVTAEKDLIMGNHNAWLLQFLDENPALEGLVEPENYLKLEERGWRITEQGGIVEMGKLAFIHGDTIKGNADPARSAMQMYGRNIRFGHFHTYKSYTHYNPVNARDVKTAIAVPGMCVRNPTYGKNAPNSWVQGFNFGYIWPDGRYSDYIVVMTDSGFVAPGSSKKYNGRELCRLAA